MKWHIVRNAKPTAPRHLSTNTDWNSAAQEPCRFSDNFNTHNVYQPTARSKQLTSTAEIHAEHHIMLA